MLRLHRQGVWPQQCCDTSSHLRTLPQSAGRRLPCRYCPEDKIEAWDCGTCKLHPKVTDITLLRRCVSIVRWLAASGVYDAGTALVVTRANSSDTDTQAFAAYDPATDVVWVAFRGTDPLNIKNVSAPAHTRARAHPHSPRACPPSAPTHRHRLCACSVD